MSICQLKLRENEYALLKDKWLKTFLSSSTNEVCAYYDIEFDQVNGRTLGFREGENTYILADEKLHTISFGYKQNDDQKAFKEIKDWLEQNGISDYSLRVQIH